MLSLTAVIPWLRAFVESAVADEDGALSVERALHVMKGGFFTIVFVRQFVIENQALDALLLRAFSLLLRAHGDCKAGV